MKRYSTFIQDVIYRCQLVIDLIIFPFSKVHLFEIVLEKGGGGRPVFVPGEEVKGRVVIRCSGGLKLRSLSVTMKGAGRVHWTEYRARNNERYSAEIEYFKKKRRVAKFAIYIKKQDRIWIFTFRDIGQDLDLTTN